MPRRDTRGYRALGRIMTPVRFMGAQTAIPGISHGRSRFRNVDQVDACRSDRSRC